MIVSMSDLVTDKEKLQRLFGAVLKDVRTKKGVSQQALALDCDLDRTYISLLERGLRTPTLHTIFVLADQLGASPADILQLVMDKSGKGKK